jgi:AcrR family transcriptional regulator
MTEIAAPADAEIGSLYRFFPNKEALADALMRHYAEVPRTEYDAIHTQALARVQTALTACCPALYDNEADDIAAVVPNNIKTMVGMTMKDAPTNLGSPEELRFMNRLYLAAKLAPGELLRKQQAG